MSEEKLPNLERAVRELRERYYQCIAEEVIYSNKSYAEIGRAYGVSEQTVYNICRMRGIQRARADADVPSTSENGDHRENNNVSVGDRAE
jgi:DNA invertase Pin-like site-specific DNA recombinase